MSPLLARVMLTIFMLPCAALVYLTLWGTLRMSRGLFGYGMRYSDLRLLTYGIAGAATFAFCAVYWFAIWRRTVSWTSGRLGSLALWTVAIAVFSWMLWFFVSEASRSQDFALLVGTIAPTPLWLIASTIIWRETAAERAARSTGDGVSCPTCGYNLTGLKGTRCPECGTEFTLDQLLAARRESAGSELI